MEKIRLLKSMVKDWFRPYIIWALVAVILGGLIASIVIDKPNVGIVRVSGTIHYQGNAEAIVKMLRHARGNDNIKAVVLEINSPGGEASAVEEVYLNVLRLKKEKPVVASINQWAASGGYYIAAASNFIYAKPTSMLGNIGVWVRLPPPEEPHEDIIPSGPFKGTGASRRKVVNWLEMVKEGFLRAVISQREERLKLSKEELSQAEIYIGIEGLRYGLIDEIGTTTDAIQKAASLAGIRNYGLVDVSRELNLSQSLYGWMAYETSLEPHPDMLPAYYYLYFEPE